MNEQWPASSVTFAHLCCICGHHPRLYCSDGSNSLTPPPLLSGSPCCDIQSVLAGQLRTDSISSLAMVSAPLCRIGRHDIEHSPSFLKLRLAMFCMSFRDWIPGVCMLIKTDSLDDTHMLYLGYSTVLCVVPSIQFVRKWVVASPTCLRHF